MRKCLVIGSSLYDHPALDPLPGAEADADTIHATLTDARYGAYDPSSPKLIDPTLEQLRDALASEVLCDVPLDVFTFYFAGHGDVSANSFYMFLRDSVPGQLSRTAFGIAELFNVLNEGHPQQVNIVIDACRAGGVALDLSQAIKVETVGTQISPNISLLAAADMLQAAEETDAGGVATMALVQALRGTDATASAAPYLDLVTLGSHVAARMADAGADQAPIVWGLNLTGPSRFSFNPHADNSPVPLPATITGVAPSSPIAQRLESRRESLWRMYLDLGREVDLGALLDELARSIDLLDPATSQTSDFVLGLSYSLPARAKATGEPFVDAEVLAGCAASLLPIARFDPKAGSAIEDIATRFVKVVAGELKSCDEALRENWRYLLSKRGGYGDLIVLPLRISKMLGYIGALDLVLGELGGVDGVDDAAARSVTQRLAEDFDKAIVCVSDSQAAYVSVFFGSAIPSKCTAEAERIFGLMFSDFIARDGKVLAAEFGGAAAFQYCWSIVTQNPMPTTVPLAAPTTLLALLLSVSVRLGIQDTVDPYLHMLDHHSMNIYIPSKITDFMLPSIPEGVNVTLSIGAEHELGCFTVEEFTIAFSKCCTSLLQGLLDVSREERLAATFASLVRPDRILWSLVSPASSSADLESRPTK